MVRAACGSKPVRETKKVPLVDGVQHLDRGALDEFVLQCGNPEWALLPVGLRYVHPSNRPGPVCATLQPFGQVLEVFLQTLPVMLPRLTVHTGGGFLLQREVGRAQRVQVIDMVQERREPRLPVLPCHFTYPFERTGRAVSALCPRRVLLNRVPFGQTPSLHSLRRRLPGLVRLLPRYYGSVRLPALVHRRRPPSGFPTRPTAPPAAGKHRISRFPRKVFPYVLGVSDRAESEHVSRYRHARCGLPLLLTASALRRKLLSRLNTRPARAPVNASMPASRVATHDSGSMWLATPSLYDSFIHNTLPV